MEQALMAAGLTQQQAQAYIFILETNPATPANIALHLGLTRTNAYKIADKLVEIGLIAKQDIDKKIAYTPNDPIALSGLVAEARTRMVALERATKEAMRLIKGRLKADISTEAKIYKGRDAVVELFRQQTMQDRPMHFVSSAADLPVMGFQTMHQIRNISGPSKSARYGITPDIPGAVNNRALDATSQLERTWVPRQAYESPVEWSVCGDTLNIFVYADEPYSIRITDRHVADAFRSLWQIMDTGLKESKDYRNLPRFANRTIGRKSVL